MPSNEKVVFTTMISILSEVYLFLKKTMQAVNKLTLLDHKGKPHCSTPLGFKKEHRMSQAVPEAINRSSLFKIAGIN